MGACGPFPPAGGFPNLIESKSWKLYLNSLNQSRFADQAAVQTTLEQDLAAAAGAPVEVRLLGLDDDELDVGRLPGECLDDLPITVEHYTPSPELLSADDADIVSEDLHSHLLKSNCRSPVSRTGAASGSAIAARVSIASACWPI